MAVDFATSMALIWLGSLFAYAGSTKLAHSTAHGVGAIGGYGLLPRSASRRLAIVLPYAELSAGVLLLVTPLTTVGAVAALVFGVVFMIASASVLARGIKTACGCSGGSADPVTRVTLARALLVCAAAWLLLTNATSLDFPVGVTLLGLSLVPAAVVRRRAARRRAATNTVSILRDHDHVLHARSAGS